MDKPERAGAPEEFAVTPMMLKAGDQVMRNELYDGWEANTNEEIEAFLKLVYVAMRSASDD